MTSPRRPARRRAATAAAAPPIESPGRGVLLDTGVRVALYARNDPAHDRAVRWMTPFQGTLHTVEPVLTETAWFLSPRTRIVLAELAARGTFQVHHPDAAGYARIAALARIYADQDPDWADLTLVWLAESIGIASIATLDVADFSVYRINGRKRFELELLR